MKLNWKPDNFFKLKNLLRNVTIICVPFLLSKCSNSDSMLKDDIIKAFDDVQVDYAVAFKDVASGETLFIRADEDFHAASTMKTPVMMEVFAQARKGKFSLNESILIKNEFKSIVDSSLFSLSPGDDSETQLYDNTDSYHEIIDLIYSMIIASSNLATNSIIELVGAENVTKSMRDLGAERINVLRGVEDLKAYELGLNNTTTARDLMIIFESLLNDTYQKEDSDRMINILLDQKFNEIIPGQLPSSVRVAHKTGSITGVQHDSGIIFLQDGRKYILVLLTKNGKDSKMVVDAMATTSRIIYDYMSK